MVQTKKNQEKVVVTKICFYGSAKIKEKIKGCVMENKGSVAKMIKKKYTPYKNMCFLISLLCTVYYLSFLPSLTFYQLYH